MPYPSRDLEPVQKLLDGRALESDYESIQKIDSNEAVMSLMTGFPLVTHLMQISLGGRFRHLPPSLAAELEAFAAAEQEASRPAAPEPKPAIRRSSWVPSPALAFALRKAC
jgi:hypothetical protein